MLLREWHSDSIEPPTRLWWPTDPADRTDQAWFGYLRVMVVEMFEARSSRLKVWLRMLVGQGGPETGPSVKRFPVPATYSGHPLRPDVPL